ncbi:hypothetical protein [Pseudorhodoferax sp.]|uniref:hypothetical protein n=1 Tax=Pseudorhodoferax sp. TaxID=1993553 RepID=UPI002DD6375E|nr:hypothetical protein [Pseudorhodoferax sp.]
MTESDARKAFHTARTELQMALTKYQGARAALHRMTGEFIGTDQALNLQFSSVTAPQAAADAATPGSDGNAARYAMADC